MIAAAGMARRSAAVAALVTRLLRNSVPASSALREPIAGETVETDAELLLDPELRVMDGESFDRVLARDKKRRAKRSRLLAAAERGRGQLLRKESAEELLSAAAGEPAEPRPS